MERPIFTPQNWENCIGFYNGSVCQIISQDREEASNGLSLDHILIDEAKFVDYEKLKNETFQTNRGNEMYFSKCHLHHGLTITCDTATTKRDSWFMQMEELIEGDYLKRATALVFHPDPEKFVSGAYIKIGYFKEDANLIFQDEVHGNLFQQVKGTMDLLTTKYLRALISYEGIQRVESLPMPREALREALLNAVVHKAYESLTPIQIAVYDDNVVICQKGGL